MPPWARSGWSSKRLLSFRTSSRVSRSCASTSAPRWRDWITPPLRRAIVRDDLIVSSRTSSFSSRRDSISPITSSRFFTSRGWTTVLFEGWPAGHADRCTSGDASATRSNGPHPLDLRLDGHRLADVPSRVVAPGHEGQCLLGQGLRVAEIRRNADDREGPGRRRVEVAGLLVDAREVELRPRSADALLVHLDQLAGLRMRAVSWGHDVLADGGHAREPRAPG